MRRDHLRDRPSRMVRPLVLVAAAIMAVAALAGCRVMGMRSADQLGDPSAEEAGPLGLPAVATDAAGSGASGRVAVALPAPGAGIVGGRLVDAVTGLPVADAGVSLLGLHRRTISGPDGSFRFDAVDPAADTLVIGPAAGYVPRSLGIQVPGDGLDLGITPVLPVAPPTLIVPDFGGIVPGCGATQVMFATEALSEPAPVSLTCIDRVEEFPAVAPAGRLPLAVVHLAPADGGLTGRTTLVVELPSQPRYGAGVELDLLRLDLDRLIWIPTVGMTVEPGGRTAAGQITAFGSYLVAAPAFGIFTAAPGDEPAITRYNLAADPNGIPADVFPVGTSVVYASFDYARMSNTAVLLRTVDAVGGLRFDLERPYADQGRDNVPLVTTGGSWPPGEYVTTIYIGQPPAPQGSIPWRVVRAATPTPLPATAPPVLRPRAFATVPPAPAVPPAGAAPCRAPLGWWAYAVQPGDTLYGLARRTGTDAGALSRANCLVGSGLVAGQVIYLPRPPAKAAPALPTSPSYPTSPGWPPPLRTPATPPPATDTWPSPLQTPTTWYTPPATTVSGPTGPAPTLVAPTVPPTAIPPTAVPPTAAPPTAVPPTAAPPTTEPPAAPTPLPYTPKPPASPPPEPTLAPRPTDPSP